MSAQISIKIDNGKVPSFIAKAIERQRIVKSYLKGEIGKDKLEEHGIKFTNPFYPRTTI